MQMVKINEQEQGKNDSSESEAKPEENKNELSNLKTVNDNIVVKCN